MSDEDAALQIVGIADRGGSDIELDAGLREGRQRGGHQDGGGVGDRIRRRRETERPMRSRQIGEALGGKQRLAAIARAGETHHQPIADQLIVAHALDRNQILETGGPRRNRWSVQQKQQEEYSGKRFHVQTGSRAIRDPTKYRQNTTYCSVALLNIMKPLTPLFVLVLLLLAPALPARAARLKDLVAIEGVRDNQLVGYGLVVGLAGTGDASQATVLRTESDQYAGTHGRLRGAFRHPRGQHGRRPGDGHASRPSRNPACISISRQPLSAMPAICRAAFWYSPHYAAPMAKSTLSHRVRS